jgi:hypothetical protein
MVLVVAAGVGVLVAVAVLTVTSLPLHLRAGGVARCFLQIEAIEMGVSN